LRLKAPYYIALVGLKDFSRLVCALERAPMPSFSLKLGGKPIIAAQHDIIDGRPVIFYTEADVGSAQYVAYRASGGSEEATLADLVGNPTFVYSPILRVEKFPAALSRSAKVEKKAKYVAIKLSDLASLAKVAAYKTIYEEAPLPLFMSNERGKTVIGTPMSVSDNDSQSYYYYVLLPGPVQEPFLRYSSQKAEQPAFTSSLDEHGYIYLKVIKLAADHPLVKTYD
jgi:hypothetical protein